MLVSEWGGGVSTQILQVQLGGVCVYSLKPPWVQCAGVSDRAGLGSGAGRA